MRRSTSAAERSAARPAEPAFDEEEAWETLRRVVDLALSDLISMREAEGNALAGEFRKRLDNIKVRDVERLKARLLDSGLRVMLFRLSHLLSPILSTSKVYLTVSLVL